MSTIITLVRHGENKPYADGEQKYPGPGLTLNGKKQAKATAKYLKETKFDIIFSSDMTRALETAEEIEKFQDCKLIKDRALAEINVIVFDKVAEDKKKLKLNLQRMTSTEKLFREILKKYKDKKILIVAHGNIIRFILGASLGFDSKQVQKMPLLGMENCSIHTLEFEDDELKKIIKINSTEHLNNQ